ncbi:MAG: threonylcarbamoyl-AMP synthase [Thermofilum sp.]|nr:threonylcarbamoyl-AMP synthase [Thermofilum sp.]
MRVPAKIWKVDPSDPDPRAIEEAASILKSGGVVAFPTETVYGLGAIYNLVEAVKKVFQAKRRPMDNPLILHVSSFSQVSELAVDIPVEVHELAKRFWPGPLTIVLPKSARVPREVTGGLGKVAIRMPAHNVALKLIEAAGAPIAAPSANLSGRPSPTTAQHVIEDLGDAIDGILDAGETLYGVESTVIDLTSRPPVLLRPGSMPVEEIEKVLGVKIFIPAFARGLGEAEKAVAPGTKYQHYSPRATLILVESKDAINIEKVVANIRELATYHLKSGKKVGILCTDETRNRYLDLPAEVISLGSRRDFFQIAKRLYPSLRTFDSKNVDVILAEPVEERGLGLTIMNRLRKASSQRILV